MENIIARKKLKFKGKIILFIKDGLLFNKN
jgi:hypothetical protein